MDSALPSLARRLREEAQATNERRLLVLAGDREAGVDAAFSVVEAVDGSGRPADGRESPVSDDAGGVTFVTTREGFRFDRIEPKRTAELLGTTRDVVVLDAHADFSPNALGRVVGAVDGGGLLVLLTPPLDAWPGRRDAFDESLAVPPFDVDDVSGRFRSRLVSTLRQHPGVAVYDLDADAVERDGLTGDGEAQSGSSDGEAQSASGNRKSGTSGAPSAATVSRHRRRAFPAAAYEACRTADQSRAVRALEALREGAVVVVEADRGRGKSAAAGLAVGSLAAEGRDVLVAAPSFRSAGEVFARARALLEATDDLASASDDGRTLTSAAGGRIRFADPPEAAALPDSPDAVVVDEAAALPVRLLSQFLDAPAAAFVTTVHGYEGAGRGFSVRFRDRLADADVDAREVRLDEPIRYACGDPVEAWAFRALLLDARPAVDPLVADATPGNVRYRALSPDDLLDDEHRLREAFGLLVLAHYRTEPDDLARLLDAPNLRVRCLTRDGHVASVALLAREGGVDADTRRGMYDGQRVRGNMLPDVLTSQLRDEDAGIPVGYRVLRIATHHAVRSEGLGSRLLAEIRAELEADVDWFGVGYGATPRLVRFWRRNGYRTVHVSTTRNAASGEYSALMLAPASAAGRDLHDRHARWFRDRMYGALSDALSDLDPDVARAALRATDAPPDLDLSARDWRVVAGAAYGPGLYDAAPAAFRVLVLAHLLDGEAALSARMERLLVRKVLQGDPWSVVADELGYVSIGQCRRALGAAFEPLVDRYGTEAALEERARYAGD